MDVAKENASAITDRMNLKSNLAVFSTTKKLTALSDVRNTVHKKNVGEPSLGNPFLDTERALQTPSPRQMQTPLVKCLEDADTVQEDETWMHCRCIMENELSSYEDNFLPNELVFNEADLDNLCKIWFGQGGRDSEDKFVFNGVIGSKEHLDMMLLQPSDIMVSSNDSGVQLDIDFEMDEVLW